MDILSDGEDEPTTSSAPPPDLTDEPDAAIDLTDSQEPAAAIDLDSQDSQATILDEEEDDGAATLATAPAVDAAAPPAAAADVRTTFATDDEFVAALPHGFALGVIVGETGAGKSRALAALRRAGVVGAAAAADGGGPSQPSKRAVVSQVAASDAARAAAVTAMDRQFGAQPSAEKCAAAALDRLSSVGLNDLHTWLRPLACLSNGQRERAAVAMRMQSGLAIDDVGATVDERNATVLAAGIARLVRRQKLERVVLTSSKAEVVRWTGAAWAYFPATRTLVVNAAPGAKPQVRLTLDDDETDEQFMRKLPPPPPPPGPQPTSSVMHTSKLWGHGKQVVLESEVVGDAATEAASSAFEIAFNGKHRFEVPRLPELPKSWRVALVNGVSGSGKSSVLRQMVQEHGCVRDAAEYGGESGGDEFAAAWPDDAPAVGAVGDGGAALLTEMGGAALAAAAAARPWRQLSRGERTLLALARLCCEPPSAAAPPSALLIADEFTSFVDRSLAKRAAEALGRAWRRRGDGRRLVLAGVHADFLRELRPEWVFETAAGELTSYTWDDDAALPPPAPAAPPPPRPPDEAVFRPPTLELTLRKAVAKGADRKHEKTVWTTYFEEYHYLDGSLNHSAHCRVGRIGATPVAFVASLMAVGVKEVGLLHSEGRLARREHRLVVRPEWQGLGIGPRVSDINARDWVLKGVRFLSRTAHPRFGAYRNNSPLWQATTANETANLGDTFSSMKEKKGKEVKKIEKARPSFSHEYIGDDECKAAAKEAKAERLAAAAATPAAAPGGGAAAPASATKEEAKKKAAVGTSKISTFFAGAGSSTGVSPLRTPPPAAPAAAAPASAVQSVLSFGGGSSRKRPAPAPAADAPAGGGKRNTYMCRVCGKPKKGHVCTGPPETAAPAAAPVTAPLASANQPLRRDASDASSSTEAPPTTDEGRDDPANDWVLCD